VELSIYGFIGGFLVGLTGVGAGSIFTPGLILFFNISPIQAVGVSLAHSFVAKSVGSLVHIKMKNYDANHLKWLVGGAVPAALLTPYFLNFSFFLKSDFSYFFRQAIGVLIIVAVLISFLQEKIVSHLKKILRKINLGVNGILLVIGIVVGFLVSLTSVGSGPLVLLGLLFIPSLSAKKAVGTTIIFGIFVSLAASLSYAIASLIDWEVLVGLLLGSVPGILIGSLLVGRFKSHYLKKFLLLFLFLLGLKLLLS
jgi:hypothetical protein